jgi:YD repeat-containing protein
MLPRLAAALLAPALAAAQPAPAPDAAAGGPGIPEPLRGAWFQGDCARPEAMLFVTARAAARVPESGAGLLLRFVATGGGAAGAAGWTLGTAGGAEAQRLLLRPAAADPGQAAAPDALETAEPDAKTRDDRLPGDAPVQRWSRCPGVPPGVAALHGEGVAALAALEHIEAACGGGGADTRACLAALVAQGDVTRDGMLGAAELARLARGAAWIVAVQQGGSGETLAAATGLGALAGLAAARGLLESLDYDGDGRLSAEELAQDRVAFGAAGGTPQGRPLRSELAGPGLDALRELLGGIGLGR